MQTTQIINQIKSQHQRTRQQ